MSIYFDFEVGKTGRRLRRAVESDKHEIKLILDQEHAAKQLFGEVNIGALIELSVLSICMINKRKEVIGFMALSDHPNIPSVDPAEWEYWIRNLYQRFYLSRNTLFIHFLCCYESAIDFFLEETLISVFNNDCYLQHIVLVVPVFFPEKLITRHAVFKRRNFYKFLPRGFEERIGSYLITANRQDFCPKLRMRRAVEEDNDDIVEILDKTCPRLKELYGAYYISELIGRHPESQRKILVGDIQGRAVAVICLNKDINYRNLQKTYELKPFNGLTAATPLEKEQAKRANDLLAMFGNPILKGQWHPFDFVPKETQSHHSTDSKDSVPSITKLQKSKCGSGKVNFKKSHHPKLKKSLEHIIVKRDSDDSDKVFNLGSSPAMSQTTLFSAVVNMLDDDPFDYDIVNIDKNWLVDAASWEVRPMYSIYSMRCTPTSEDRTRRKPKTHKQQSKNVQIMDTTPPTPNTEVGNAFMIELFALREDIDERFSFDMLEAAFELMKEYDYGIIRIPTSERYFPLLQHFCFVPTKQRVCCEYALYVAHRSSVMGRLRVREAELIDIPDIATMLYPLDGKDTLQSVENMIFNNKESKAYVLTSGMNVVGLAILELPEEIDFLRCRFNLDAFQKHKYRFEGNGIDAGFASVKSIIIYPAFEVHYRYFARELMRLSGSNTLIYVTAYRNKWVVHKGNALVSAMVPLVPRRCEIDSDTLHSLKRISAISDAIVAFSAWFIGTKFTSIPKVTITNRIVIIGASRTALGFLQALLFEQASTYLTFTNVTLISIHGLPYMRHAKAVAESMFLRYYTSSDKYLKSVPYTYYVNVIQGKMAEINLQEKYITLTSGNQYHYDLLFLFFGKQYQHPSYMAHLLERERHYQNLRVPEYSRLDVPRLSDTELQITCAVTPENVFIINHILEAHKALNYVKNYVCQPNEEFKIIVYGSTIHPYLCINALLNIGVQPEHIIFVEPFPSEDPKKTRVSEFCNFRVDRTVEEVLNNLKIKVYRSYYFQGWAVDMDNVVTSVEFLSNATFLQLDCSVFFFYGQRGINMRAFVAAYKSGLSYDGGIVIDQECRTRDPSVYAAGPNTRYHRRYYANEYAHKYFDSYEVGFKLGTRIRNQLDPLFSDRKSTATGSTDTKISFRKESRLSSCKRENDDDFKKLDLMTLVKPKVKCCVLPGGLRYLEVRSPGKKLPHHYVQSLTYNGFVMETFKKGYFKLHLTKDLYVDGITCLCPAQFSLEKFKHLYGLSAVVLKNVHLRYSTHKVDNFYEFFRAPWADFLYHDQTKDLLAMTKELLPKHHPAGLTIKDALRESLKDNPDAHIRDDFKKSPYVEAITDYVVDWLSCNDVLLPMYLQPWQSSQYSYDVINNPLFKERDEYGH